MSQSTSVQAPALAAIDTAALAVMIRSHVPMVILDARAEEYDDGRRIPGAKRLGARSSEAEAQAAIGSKDALIVTYCSNLPCPASMALYKLLKSLGYENVLDYPDGIAGWQAARYPVEQALQK